MGNQGMTNWKFTAFLTIALMLVAGLFSNAAMASNGQGTMTITTITPGGAAGNAIQIQAGTAAVPAATPPTPAIPAILSANGNGLSLVFTYSVAVPAGGSAINMDGGLVEIAIPTGWTVPHASVTADDGGPLFPTDSTADDATDANKRIVLTKNGDNATAVGIKLTGDEWSVAANETATLTITLGSVTTATPSSLYVPAGAHPYQEYTFRTRSMAKDGSLRSLVIADSGLNPQPRLRVGVVTAGKGQLDVSPIVYESEEDRNISLVFTAQGPMYDYTENGTEVNSTIAITIPTGLTAPQTTTTNGDGFITVSRQSGTVHFRNPNEKISVSGQVATIDITRMENGAKIYVAYRKVDVPAGVTADRFTAQAASVSSALVDVVSKPDGNHVRTITGSGEITLTTDVVGMGTKPTLTFVYKAATKLTDAILVIDQPDAAATPAWTNLVLQSGDSRADNYVSFSGGDSGTALDLDPSSADTNQNVSATAGDAITLRGVTLNAGASVTVRITRTTLTGAAGTDPLVPVPNGVYAWPSTLNGSSPADTLADPMLYVVGDARANVAFQIVDIVTTDPAGASAVALPHYNAAEKTNIWFQFATTTPIKGGYVQFTIPNNWAQPSLTDVAGKATVKLVGWNATDSVVTFTAPTGADDDMRLAVSGNTITVHIKASPAGDITVQYGTGTGDNQGMVQNRAVDNLEIVGRFKTGSSSGAHPAAAPVSVRVGNVKAGSGTAMITTPASHKVKAGSDKNNITIVYSAAGTMNGGTVRLRSPENWGTLQETDTTGDNHIRVAASSSMVNQADISYGPRYVLVPLLNVEANNTVSFMFSNVKVQTQIGLAEFTIESAGGPSDSLARLEGEALPKDADDKAITDRYMLLGKVYVPRFAVGGTIPERIGAVATEADVTNDTGVIRLEVEAGAGGTGEATLLEIVRSDAGLRDYLNEAGDALESVRKVHAGDEEIYLVFKYEPVDTITDGALRFTVPSDWSMPQEDSSTQLGYTEIRSSGANTGAPSFENRVVTIPIVDITSADSIEIHYGSGSIGAKAPTAKKTSEFGFAVKGTSGSFANIGTVKVDVRSQASGRGSASIAPMNATAGATDVSITITYDPEGQIANGRIKLTVPDALTGGADGDGVTASHISVSTGSAKYGGSVDLSLDANADVTKNDVLVSGVNLSASGTFTFTYEGMMPEAAGDLAFTVAVDGGEGPGEVAEGSPAPMALVDGSGALTVTVGQAAAGSGTVMVAQDPGAVVAGSTGNTITVTYTAIGEIGEGKTIKVTVPDGWSPPLNEAAADEKMGTFTAKHYLKLAADDADGMPNAGDAVAASTMKAEGAAADAMPMIMVATVASGKMVKAGDMVKFTYTNATAPADTGPSYFTTTYDGMQVGENADVKVIVQSAEGATAVTLAADDFNVDTDGSTTVTITLVASDGSPATGSEDTVVTLTADGGTIASSVTIAAGDYHAETELSATASADITITAAAEGLTDAEIMVHADTDNVVITSVTLSQSIAKAGDTVTVTAMGSAAQDGMFSVGDVITDEDLAEDEAGSYTGSFTVVADLQDGSHPVTVSLNGASDDSASVTIDTMAPTVTASTDAGDRVANGDTVTISATADDGTGSGIASVMADVSALDTTQTDMVALTMGDDGSYSAEITISEDNEADNGTHTITVTATDMAGNESDMASADVALQNSISFTSMIPTGANLFHVPLNDPDITTVGSLRTVLGDAVTSLIVRQDGSWEPDSDDVMVTSDLGIYLVATSDITATFEGDAWEDTTVSLEAGANLVGLPVNDPSVTMASDISGLFDDGIVLSVTAGSGGQYTTVSATSDVAVAGDAAYYIVASAAGSATLTGDGWENGGGGANAAPIALSGYKIGSQTPALAVYGSVTDEITGLAKEGFRVKVKNLTTKAGLSEITSVETAEGYSMAFVDLKDARAARIGDILEISADSPNPLIGVQPVRHVVTVDDVKNGTITLEDLIAYEIPAETELLRNYPNPFNPETWIPYHLSEDADVSLTIYDVNGVLVRDIDVGHQTAAKYDTRSKAIYWDGRNQFGEQVASGIYFYSLSAGDFSATRKMVILK